MLELYHWEPNGSALKTLVCLHEKSLAFTSRYVDLLKFEQCRPEFLALNPKHKVPVLVIDGEPLTENVAIQIWIHRQFPAAGLLPAEPRQEIQAISLMAWCASGIHPRLTPNVRPENYCDLPGSEESVKRVANKLLFEDMKVIDDILAGREWFFRHFTACDAYFFWCFRRAVSFNLDLSGFRNCMAHFERMHERASVQRVIAYEKQVQEAFARAA